MEKILKKDRGITLIALVITIVVLIILATVAINISLGENGIFNRAKFAKEQYQNAENQEKEAIAKNTNDIDTILNYGGTREGLSEAEVDAKIASAIQNVNKEELLWENQNKSSAFAAQTVSWTTTEYNRVYVIYKNYKDDSDTSNVQTVILYPGRNTSMIFAWGDSSIHVNRRVASFSAAKNSVTFGKSNASGTETTDHIIPLYIIGYKSAINI